MNAPQTNKAQGAAQKAAPEQAVAPKRSFRVWYRPGPEDRAVTVWNGITFHAGTPVALSLDNPRHYVVVDVKREIQQEDGTFVTKTSPGKMPMVELAKSNSAFEVEGFPRFTKVLPAGRRPQSADEYRTWAMAWIQQAGDTDDTGEPLSALQSPRDLLERWEDEDAMRERCGVGEDDVMYLKPFFDMKVHSLKQAARGAATRVMHAKGDGGDGFGMKPERYSAEA